MTKLLSSVGLAILATVSLLAGCQLYFGDRDSNGNGNGNTPPGFPCKGNAECAAGCHCADGICVEAGFCSKDADCGAGFHCDTARSSCIPNPACNSSDDCAQGSACDNGGCVKTCTCTTDAEAIQQGAGWCDETRNTCMLGTDPKGACLGEITCTNTPPRCPVGQVALRKDGCFTGECRAIAACEAAPTCNALQHQGDCEARTDCGIVTIGRGCRRPDGTACQPGDTGCVCESHTFAACEDKGTTSPRIIIQ